MFRSFNCAYINVQIKTVQSAIRQLVADKNMYQNIFAGNWYLSIKILKLYNSKKQT